MTIVFTNGCFDLLHVGHVRYLDMAKKLGDYLIVGLNSDASFLRCKKRAPINPDRFRAEMLSALKSVDEVIIFEEDTPYNLIKKLTPNILVKGGDYKVNDIVGNELVDFTVVISSGISLHTSDILNKIKAT